VQLGAPGVRLNPLDIPVADRRPDALTRRAVFLHTVIAVLVGTAGGRPAADAGLRPEETAALDTAIVDTYLQAGITADPATWDTPAPLLRDLAATLRASAGPAAKRLAARLAPWVTGSFKDLFDGPTTSRPDGHLVVWSLRHLPDELRPIGTLLALDSIWRQIDQPPSTLRRSYRPQARWRLVVVDEAWMMLRDGAAADWLCKMAKAARKRHAGLAVVTQDAADVLGTELGQAVVANSATQILMRQAPQAIDRIADTFGLTDAERHLLLSARRGEALLVAGSHRVRFEVVSSAEEHQLAVTAGQPPGLQPATGPASATATPTDDADLF
jgi:hypothetical protein